MARSSNGSQREVRRLVKGLMQRLHDDLERRGIQADTPDGVLLALRAAEGLRGRLLVFGGGRTHGVN